MTFRNITSQLERLAAIGITEEQVYADLGPTNKVLYDEGVLKGWHNAGANAVTAYLERKEREHSLTQAANGERIEWRKISGTWLIAGRELIPGTIVTVTRRNGTTSQEMVGDIVATIDGLTYARTGTI